MSVRLDDVARLVEQVAAQVVAPAFRTGLEGEEKAPGEVVSRVDREAEALLSAGLRDLLDAPVVGEEAASADPSLLRHVGAGRAWLVDPLDGTAAFLAGSPDHAVLVALVEGGTTTAAVLHQPAHGRTWVAARGAGAWRDDVRVRVPARRPGPLRGAALTRFLPPRVRAVVDAAPVDLTPPSTCAGVLYPLLAEGDLDLLLFWRTLPWDHAAGALLAVEAGATARRPDGRAYRPGEPGDGLLVAAPGSAHDAAALLGLA